MNTHLEYDSELLTDIVAKSKQKETETTALYENNQDRATREAIEIEGRRKFFELRTHWSKAVIAWITLIIVFNIILSWQIGVGHWNFEKYEWFLGGMIAQNIGQIIGLGYLVVKFLFPKSPQEVDQAVRDLSLRDPPSYSSQGFI